MCLSTKMAKGMMEMQVHASQPQRVEGNYVEGDSKQLYAEYTQNFATYYLGWAVRCEKCQNTLYT